MSVVLWPDLRTPLTSGNGIVRARCCRRKGTPRSRARAWIARRESRTKITAGCCKRKTAGPKFVAFGPLRERGSIQGRRRGGWCGVWYGAVAVGPWGTTGLRNTSWGTHHHGKKHWFWVDWGSAILFRKKKYQPVLCWEGAGRSGSTGRRSTMKSLSKVRRALPAYFAAACSQEMAAQAGKRSAMGRAPAQGDAWGGRKSRVGKRCRNSTSYSLPNCLFASGEASGVHTGIHTNSPCRWATRVNCSIRDFHCES